MEKYLSAILAENPEYLRSVAPAWAGPSGKELAVPRGCVLHTERVQAAEVGRIVSGVSKPD
jgi:hypothetical protein